MPTVTSPRKVSQRTLRTVVNFVAGVCSGKGKTGMPDVDIRQIYPDIRLAYPLLPLDPGTVSLKIAQKLPGIDTPLTMEDRKHGFVCKQIPITAENREAVDQARGLVAGSLRKFGYEGWSDDIDWSNDRHAFYFVVYNGEGDIVATSRMIHRREDNTLPLEQGFKPDGSHYSIADIPAVMADINSFYFKREKGNVPALFLLYATMARYAALNGVNRAFCMLDPNNAFIKKLYLKAGFRFSDRFPQPIYFPTFGKTTEGRFEATRWTVMEMGAYRILLYASMALKYHQL